MRKINFLLLIALFLIGYTACDLPEHYWDKSPECQISSFVGSDLPGAPSYQSKVQSFLTGKTSEEFRYFFDTFISEGSETYMMTEFRNDKECFTGKVLVRDWSKLGGMKRVNGKGYPKELYDLQWKIKTIGGKQEILYQDMHDIID